MKLIPKAKPVKIRIKSGGEEHSSLDSLLHNFNVSDIKPLLDGRLVRWLKQQGEKALADIINEVKVTKLDTSQGVMDLIKIFFPKYIESNSIKDIQKLIECWLKSAVYRKNGEHLFSYITGQLSNDFSNDKENLALIKYLYKNRVELGCHSQDWYSIFLLHIQYKGNENIEGDSEILYILGKMLCEGRTSTRCNTTLTPFELGFKWIDKAARLGYKDAYSYISEYTKRNKEYQQQNTYEETVYNSPKRFEGVDIFKLKTWIRDHWGVNKFEIQFSENDYVNSKEKKILDFICQLHRLGWYAEHMGFNKTLDKANTYFGDCKQDMLAKEKKFIIGLLYKWCGNIRKANNIFNEIRDYKLANYMLRTTRIIDHLDFKSMSFQNQLTFIKDHLFDYE